MLTICQNNRVYVVTFPGVIFNTYGRYEVGDETLKCMENQSFFFAKGQPDCLVCCFNNRSQGIPRYFDLFRYDEDLIEKGTEIDEYYLMNRVFPHVCKKLAEVNNFEEHGLWSNEFLFAKGDRAYIMNKDGIKPVWEYTSDLIYKNALTAVMKTYPEYSVEDKVKEFIKLQDMISPYNFYPFAITDTLTRETKFVDKP